jgi:DNA-directed RNA polymerase specialized sigma24 family protein
MAGVIADETDALLLENPHRGNEMRQALVRASDAKAEKEQLSEYRRVADAYRESMLGRLTESQRAALELHEMEGLSDRDIATIIGSSPHSVVELRRKAKRICQLLVKRGELPAPPRAED